MRLTFRTQNFKAWYIGNAPSLGLAPWITVDCSCITSAREPFCEPSSVEMTDFFTYLAFLLKTPGEHLTVFRLFARVSERKNMILGTPCQCGLSVETNFDLRNSKLGNFKLTQFKQATKKSNIYDTRLIFPCGNESTVGRRWPKTTAERHAAAGHGPVCCSSHFNCTHLYLCVHFRIAQNLTCVGSSGM